MHSQDGEEYRGLDETGFQEFMKIRGYKFVAASAVKNRCLFFAVNNALVGLNDTEKRTNPVMHKYTEKLNDRAAANDLVDKVVEVQKEAENEDNTLYRRVNGDWIFDKENGFGEDGELLAIAYVLKIRIIVFYHTSQFVDDVFYDEPYTNPPVEYTMLSRDPLNLSPQQIKATIVIACHNPRHYDSYVVSPFPNDWTDEIKVQEGTLERARMLSAHLYKTLAPENIRKEYYKLQRQAINREPLHKGLKHCVDLLSKDREAAWIACKNLNENLYTYVEEFAELTFDNKQYSKKAEQIREYLNVERQFQSEDKESLWKQYREVVEKMLLALRTANADTRQADSLAHDIGRSP
jgi:hypothetical protein